MLVDRVLGVSKWCGEWWKAKSGAGLMKFDKGTTTSYSIRFRWLLRTYRWAGEVPLTLGVRED
ncbi:hypothetical protein RTBOTA2_000722 [Rhodotorula toruloides]|nr:hypothetical protein RTBOTA2_000722 [Rhodotorula toruloides]